MSENHHYKPAAGFLPTSGLSFPSSDEARASLRSDMAVSRSGKRIFQDQLWRQCWLLDPCQPQVSSLPPVLSSTS